MFDTPSIDSMFGTLSASIKALWAEESAVARDRVTLSSFADFLTKNKDVVSGFGRAAEELEHALNSFDFTAGYRFDAFQNWISSLGPLRISLADLSKQAALLKGCPDRYGAKDELAQCDALMRECRETMSLDDVPKASARSDAHIKKLKELQLQFKRDADMLDEIHRVMAAKKALLDQFKAYDTELKQYVAEFPHEGENDLQVVKDRIETLAPMLPKLEDLSKQAALLEDCPDRYGAKDELAQCDALMKECREMMCLDDVPKASARSDAHIKKLKELQLQFKRDADMLDEIHRVMAAKKALLDQFKAYDTELKQYVAEFPHEGENDLQVVKDRIETLAPMLPKLEDLSKQAALLEDCPDRYGAKDELAQCDALMKECREMMCLDDVPKASARSDAHIKKLKELQLQFKRDADMLTSIHRAIDAETKVLGRYEAYRVELMQFVSEFPHEGKDDLQMVKDRIEALVLADTLRMKVEEAVESIRQFFDRYQKSLVVDDQARLDGEMRSSMRFADVEKYRGELEAMERRISTVERAFEAERNGLVALRDSLSAHKEGLWKEDNIRLLAKLKDLCAGDPRKKDLDLDRLRKEVLDAKAIRSGVIHAMVIRYPWLESSKRYKKKHDDLLRRFITSTEYNSVVGDLRWDRFQRLVLLCIPVIGWAILLKWGD